MDENQPNTLNSDTDSPAPPTDSPVVEMPSEAPESSTNVVDAPPNKDDNGAVIPTESPIQKLIKTEEIPVNSTPVNTPTQTAQMVDRKSTRLNSSHANISY